MIIDIIEIPIKIPPYIDVNTETLFWSQASPWYESYVVEDLLHVGRILDSSAHVLRYKIVESRPGMIIERSVLSRDELDLSSFSLKNTRDTSIPLYPITTKIHRITSNGIETSAYRHFNSITSLLSETYMIPMDSLCSVHELYLATMRNTMQVYDLHDLIPILDNYELNNQQRLKSLLCANEFINTKLSSNMTSVVGLQINLIRSAAHASELVELIDDASKLPKLESYDNLSLLTTQQNHIESHKLRGYLAPNYHSHILSRMMMPNDIFELTHSVEYEVPDTLRWMIFPLINKLDLLPYTDLSITFDGRTGDIDVHYAVSNFGNVPDLKKMTCKESISCDTAYNVFGGNNNTLVADLNLCLSKIILNLPLGKRITDLEYNIVKTFHDDVYLTIKSKVSNETWKYYFDLTLYSLGTRGILNTSVMKQIANSAVPAMDVYPYY